VEEHELSGNYEITANWSEDQYYEIRLKGHLSLDWSDWFEGLSISHEENGITLLSGIIKDQAALFGIFNRIHNLGMP
jgi:hypothetical protein